MNVITPEPLVNNAWRHLIVQDFSIINGDRMNYSAGNQYEKMYAAESSDAALPLVRTIQALEVLPSAPFAK